MGPCGDTEPSPKKDAEGRGDLLKSSRFLRLNDSFRQHANQGHSSRNGEKYFFTKMLDMHCSTWYTT